VIDRRRAAWTTQGNVALAREMWDAGELCADIARAVGCSRHALLGYAHRHGWPPHPKPPPGAAWRAQRKAAQAAQQAPKPRRPPRPAPPRGPAVAAPVPPRGPRREACNPEPLAVPTAAFRTCQYIAGDDRRTWEMCGAPVVPQGVYCADHYGRCYYRARWHAEVAA
jgi:hypothetical protein